ncbi:glucose transporter type 1 isoform X2 [Aplysia californica]|uniref:Glucose transporter type 1 isoform X2 n=1 Tax=Aplysia californica TaxID=6500 RepID=A0ABM1VU72_APLCA|nr:glucose transporter type 1 isoform X2 [Aplysia californica]
MGVEHGGDGKQKTHSPNDTKTSQIDHSAWTWQFISVLVISYTSMSALTYVVVCLNAPTELIKQFINDTNVKNREEALSKEEVESLFGLLVAVVGIGSIVGCLTAASIADAIGRKFGIFLSSVTGACGTLIMALAETAGSYEMLFVGRVVLGVGLGWNLTIAPSYLAEMCRPSMKAFAVVLNMLFQSFAFIVAQVLGYEEFLGNKEHWSLLIGLPVVVIAVHLLLLMFCPESPRYLLMKKSDYEGAKAALRKIRGIKDVQYDIDLLNEELAESTVDAQISVIGLAKSPVLRKPLIIAIVLGLQQNWCGTNAILFFSTSLFEDAGVSTKDARYATSGTGIIFFICNIVSIAIIPRFGRKTIFTAGTLGMGLASAVIAITMVYKDEVEALKYVNVCVSLLIVASYALGPICVFWTMLSELFPHSARSAGFGVAVTGAFTGYFVHCYVFPEMLNTMHSYTFFVFAVIDVLTAVFVVMYIPETKNKSFAEIASTWTYAPATQTATPDSDAVLYPKEIVIEPASKDVPEIRFSPPHFNSVKRDQE